MDRSISHRSAPSSSGIRGFIALGLVVASVIGVAPAQAQQMCGGVTYPFPYTDVASVTDPFCPGIMEAYVTGISKGTTPTTFSPNNDVIRLQMTTFLQRTVDQVLTRGSRRAALNQWWTPQNTNAMQTIVVGDGPVSCAADGAAVWTTTYAQVVQVQANTGTVLGAWTGATNSWGVVAAAGKVFVVGNTSPGNLYVIDPTQSPGLITTASSSVGVNPVGIAFDGINLWSANIGPPGSVSIIEPTSPYNVTTVTTGFNRLFGILYDGSHIWVTDQGAGKLFKLDATGAIVQTVTVGSTPDTPVFDGANIWVPNFASNSIIVVQASTGNVVATINGDGINLLDGPTGASFDGERVLITNLSNSSVSMFKAADLSFIANVPTGSSTEPAGPCSDAINFWVNLSGAGNLLRF